MATWIGACRSNWFRVRDRAAFLALLYLFELDFDEADGAFCFMDSGEGGTPSRFSPDGREIEIFDEIAPYLADNETCILFSVGFENRCYLAGQAVAVHASGAQVSLDLCDIAGRARASFGPEAIVVVDI